MISKSYIKPSNPILKTNKDFPKAIKTKNY